MKPLRPWQFANPAAAGMTGGRLPANRRARAADVSVRFVIPARRGRLPDPGRMARTTKNLARTQEISAGGAGFGATVDGRADMDCSFAKPVEIQAGPVYNCIGRAIARERLNEDACKKPRDLQKNISNPVA